MKEGTLLIYRAFSEINRYSYPSYQIISTIVNYQSFVINIIKALQALHDALTSSEVTVLNLCTSSGHALYLCQVLQNYLE